MMRGNLHWRVLLAGCLAAILCPACAHETPPSEMSVEQNRAAAWEASRQAQNELAIASQRSTPANAGIAPELYLYPQGSNLAQAQVDDARRLEKQAAEHEQAAAELEQAEAVECENVQPAQRSVCPSLGPVTSISDTDGGVRIAFGDPVQASMWLSRVRCHYAYARAHGVVNNPDCVLYLPDVEFLPTSNPRLVDVVARDPRTAAEIRRRAHASAIEQPR
jgi:hypothetical protein